MLIDSLLLIQAADFRKSGIQLSLHYHDNSCKRSASTLIWNLSKKSQYYQ